MFDKTLIPLSASSGRICIIFLTRVIRVLAGIASASFAFVFSLTTGIIKKVSRITGNKNRKHNKIVRIAKSKLSKIETLISQALQDLEITHEEFQTTVNGKEKY